MSGQVKDFSSPIAANLLAEMDRTEMTISKVATSLGVFERQITRWRGGREPRYEFVVKLAELFGRDTAWFYTRHDHDDELQEAS